MNEDIKIIRVERVVASDNLTRLFSELSGREVTPDVERINALIESERIALYLAVTDCETRLASKEEDNSASGCSSSNGLMGVIGGGAISNESYETCGVADQSVWRYETAGEAYRATGGDTNDGKAESGKTKELAGIAKDREEMSSETGGVTTSEAACETGNNGGTVIGATKVVGQPVGMVTVVPYKTATNDKLWIEDVCILSEFRGRGLGKPLLRFAMDDATEFFGEGTFWLTSRPSRTAARQMYKSMGFTERETGVFCCENTP